MATEAQTSANRSNAEKSTGPRTPQGKAKVAQNAVKHGLLARSAVLQGEEWEEYTCFSEELLDELYPDGMVEQELANRIVDLSWRLRRAARNQGPIFEALYDKHAADPEAPFPPEACPEPEPGALPEDAPNLGWMLMKDFAGERVLERMLMYERRIEHSLYRTMAELEKRQRRRHEAYAQARADREQRWGAVGHAPAGGRGPERWEEGRNAVGCAPRTSAADGSVRDTHPTGAGPRPFAEEVGRGRPTHEEGPQTQRNAFGNPETPDGVTTNLAQAEGQSCETNPICEGIRVQGSGVRDLTPDTRPLTPGPSCETNPICGGANKGQVGYRPIFRRRR